MKAWFLPPLEELTAGTMRILYTPGIWEKHLNQPNHHDFRFKLLIFWGCSWLGVFCIQLMVWVGGLGWLVAWIPIGSPKMIFSDPGMLRLRGSPTESESQPHSPNS